MIITPDFLRTIIDANCISTTLKLDTEHAQPVKKATRHLDEETEEDWLLIDKQDPVIKALATILRNFDERLSPNEQEFLLLKKCLKNCDLKRENPSYWLMVKILSHCYGDRSTWHLERQLQIYYCFTKNKLFENYHYDFFKKKTASEANCQTLWTIFTGLDEHHCLKRSIPPRFYSPRFDLEEFASRISWYQKYGQPLTKDIVEICLSIAELDEYAFKHPLVMVKNQPSLIKIADKPLGQKTIFEQITPKAFKERFNAAYTEGLWANEASGRKPQYVEYPYLSDLVICKFDDPIGYGVCTLVEIPEGTNICQYGGDEILKNFNFKDSIYMFAYKEGICISQKLKRGFSGFISHAPKNLANYDINTTDILKANVRVKFKNGNLIIAAKHKIPANGILALDYNDHYWCKRAPRLMHEDGSLIAENTYRIKRGPIKYNKKFFYMAFSGKDVQLSQERDGAVGLSENSNNMICSNYRLSHKLARIHMIPAIYDWLPQFEPALGRLHKHLISPPQHVALPKASDASQGGQSSFFKQKISLHAYWDELPHFECKFDTNAFTPKTINVVCTTRNQEDHRRALSFFKNKTPHKILENKAINEVIIKGLREKDVRNLPNLFK